MLFVSFIEMEEGKNAMLSWAVLLVSATMFAAVVWRILLIYWWRPLSIQRALETQGIRGLKYRFLCGNIPEFAALTITAYSCPMELSHDIMPRVLPHYSVWSRVYGQRFFHWYGTTPRLTVPDPDLIKQVLSNKFGHFEKSPRRPDAKYFLGSNGLVTARGEAWALHRRIVSPAFHMEKLKAMIPTILECSTTMFEKWESQVCEAKSGRCVIDVLEQFRALTADIIARTAFGSSYKDGKQVFEMQREQQIQTAEADRTVYIPGSRFLPTPKARYRWKLDQKIQERLRRIIQNRLKCTDMGRSDFYGRDLLGIMLTANKKELQGRHKSAGLSIQDIVDECRTFFFAGHETTSTLLAWTTMLLARHSEWQDRIREELLAVCGAEMPDQESIGHLKIMTMVLNESLRLYPPAVMVTRYTYKEIKLGDVLLPKGTSVLLPILALHHSPEIWGEDVHEFKPERFALGVANASKQPLAFMPFSMGPRFCVGQNFALLEAKLILSVMLQRFSFSLSPTYRHAPTMVLTLQPQYGVQIMLEPRPRC